MGFVAFGKYATIDLMSSNGRTLAFYASNVGSNPTIRAKTMKRVVNTDEYSKDDIERRFDAALRGAFATPPKPMKDIPRNRAKRQTLRNEKRRHSGKKESI